MESDKICDSVNQEQAIHLSDSFINLDAGNWTFPITDSQRHDLIQNSPHQNIEKSDESYPKDANNRRFSKFHLREN